MRRQKRNGTSLAGRAVVCSGLGHLAYESKSITARRRHKQRPRRLPPGLLLALDAVNGRTPPMTRLERRSFARQLELVKLQDAQRRRERGYPHP